MKFADKIEIAIAIETNDRLIESSEKLLEEDYIKNFEQIANKLQYTILDVMMRDYLKGKNPLDIITDKLDKIDKIGFSNNTKMTNLIKQQAYFDSIAHFRKIIEK